MTFNVLNTTENKTNKAIFAGWVVVGLSMSTAELNPGTAHIWEGIALFGLAVTATALFVGMATSLKNAD